MSSEAALKRIEEKIDRNQEGIASNRKGIASNREGIASNREGIASNREMIIENRKVIDQVHQTVVLIEKVHGDKLEALMDGHDVLNNRIYRIEQRMDMQQMRMDDYKQSFFRLETGQQEIKADVSEIRRNVEQLTSIVSGHEDRLQKTEKKNTLR